MSKANNQLQPSGTLIDVRRDSSGKIFSPIRNKWLIETPEERVRQEYVCGTKKVADLGVAP